MPPKSSNAARRAVLILVVSKLLILWFGVQAYIVIGDQPLPTPRSWIEIWNRWDAIHYAGLISDGYVDTGEERRRIVFFPLYPWTAGAVDGIVGDPIVSAFLVSTIASLFVAWLLSRLVSIDADDDLALDAVFFLAIFPTSYFLHIGYTESLFLALALGSFLAARRRNWLAAGVIGAFASFARVNGLLLVPALALEAWADYRERREFDRRWLWLLLTGAGFAGYLALNKVVTGEWLMFLTHQREFWDRSFALPTRAIGAAWTSIWTRTPSQSIMVGWQEFLFTMIAIAAAVWSWFRLRQSYAMWITLNVLLWVSTSFLLSAPRYALTAFPLFLCFATITRERPLLRTAIVIGSLLFQALFVAEFVRGRWAF